MTISYSQGNPNKLKCSCVQGHLFQDNPAFHASAMQKLLEFQALKACKPCSQRAFFSSLLLINLNLKNKGPFIQDATLPKKCWSFCFLQGCCMTLVATICCCCAAVVAAGLASPLCIGSGGLLIFSVEPTLWNLLGFAGVLRLLGGPSMGKCCCCFCFCCHEPSMRSLFSSWSYFF